MTKNMGTADRALRILIAIVIGFLWYTGRIGGTLAIVLGILAIVFVLTSLIGWCPLYNPLKLSTRRE